MARVEIVQLFRATNRREDIGIERSDRRGWNRRTHGATLGYADFTACLAACAAVIFTGEEWEANYSTLGQKFALLLFWLERESCSEKRWKVCQPMRRREKPRARDLVAVAARRGVAVDGEEDWPEAFRPSLSGLLEAGAERRLRQLFAYYCTCGDRLNVGPHAALKLSQVVRLLADAGCLDTAHSRQRLDVALAAFGGVSRKRLSFEDLVHLLSDFACDDANHGGLSDFISRHILFDVPEPLPPGVVEPTESHSLRHDLDDKARSELEKCLNVKTPENEQRKHLLAIAAPAPAADCVVDVYSDALKSGAGSPIGGEATCSLKEEDVEVAAICPDLTVATEEIEALTTSLERETHLKQLAHDLCVGGFSDAVDSISQELGATKVAGVPLVRSLEPAHKCGGLRELRDRLHSRCMDSTQHDMPGEGRHYARMRAAAAQLRQPLSAAVGPRELRRLCKLSDEDLSRLTAPYDTPRLRMSPLRSLKAKLHNSILEQVARLRELRDVRQQRAQDRLSDSGFHAVKPDASHISLDSALGNDQADNERQRQLRVLEAVRQGLASTHLLFCLNCRRRSLTSLTVSLPYRAVLERTSWMTAIPVRNPT